MQIAAGAQTVGDVVEQTKKALLNGLYREIPEGAKHTTQRERERNKAARHAIEVFTQDLLAVWCPDANTRLSDLAVPAPAEDGSLADRLHRKAST